MTWLMYVQLGATLVVLVCLWQARRYRIQAREEYDKAAEARRAALAYLDHAKEHLDAVDQSPLIQCDPEGMH